VLAAVVTPVTVTLEAGSKVGELAQVTTTGAGGAGGCGQATKAALVRPASRIQRRYFI
jgi:hypothetical protein